MKIHRYIQLCLYTSLLLGGITGLKARDFWDDSHESRKRLVRLDGSWKFSVGDGAERAAPGYDDSDWATIHSAETWQDEGYRDYNGYAWYRKSFSLPSSYDSNSLFLSLGKIDDVDEVFVNGHRVGSTGQFPPNYQSAYDRERNYPVPVAWLQPGKTNVIAIRVYDGGGVGGLVSGRPGLYMGLTPETEIPLDGTWKFSPGDNPEWGKPGFDDSDFKTITVPLAWEDAGYPNLDGYAWYRKAFTVTHTPADQTLVLMLGKIDDYDEVFLNGVAIGRTGEIDHPGRKGDERSYALNRTYYFPTSLLKEHNTLAVRVYDAGGYGGIYAGPVSIITQSEFVRYWEARRHHPVRDLLHLFQSDD
jgi:sialate O-acetylesterase